MAETIVPLPEGLYYIRDARYYVGNCVVWWCAESEGYTCDLADAGKYTAERAAQICAGRLTDVPYRCGDVDGIATLHVTQGAILRLAAQEVDRA